ncbi:uncharacterized protein BDR25DRAFT_376093 [Lindgomyces ingoldianus]|uniref:Uncharacterized protein n=1 Tax=Lindgomyces ingoldianus TaxID=673940 RepID=A0ACB6QJM5_9PLEO|nr:uncharacterized protein BDR25DRAFT_376093 [Lindgomyces ingoldianus]KAF2467209.1 hypothetical protein BDR25DRAFT_376093 [Lindgomyces ingoldianus]
MLTGSPQSSHMRRSVWEFMKGLRYHMRGWASYRIYYLQQENLAAVALAVVVGFAMFQFIRAHVPANSDRRLLGSSNRIAAVQNDEGWRFGKVKLRGTVAALAELRFPNVPERGRKNTRDWRRLEVRLYLYSKNIGCARTPSCSLLGKETFGT